MTKIKKSVLLAVLLVLEIVFLALAVSSTRPRRESELTALTRYDQTPTEMNKDELLKEQRISERAIELRRGLGIVAAAANGILIGYIWKSKRI